MLRKRLSKVQYTLREVSCGVQFLALADERSLTHCWLLAEYVNEHLKKHGLIAKEGIRQADNGVEYCGSWPAKEKEPSAYTLAIEPAKLIHGAIPRGAHKFQFDAETAHNLIEAESYEIENFTDRTEFMQKANTYQLFFNLERPNTIYKENKNPWQVAQEKRPDIAKEAFMLLPVDLDVLLNKKLACSATGGYMPIPCPNCESEAASLLLLKLSLPLPNNQSQPYRRQARLSLAL
jgi:hypothetical protein